MGRPRRVLPATLTTCYAVESPITNSQFPNNSQSSNPNVRNFFQSLSTGHCFFGHCLVIGSWTLELPMRSIGGVSGLSSLHCRSNSRAIIRSVLKKNGKFVFTQTTYYSTFKAIYQEPDVFNPSNEPRNALLQMRQCGQKRHPSLRSKGSGREPRKKGEKPNSFLRPVHTRQTTRSS